MTMDFHTMVRSKFQKPTDYGYVYYIVCDKPLKLTNDESVYIILIFFVEIIHCFVENFDFESANRYKFSTLLFVQYALPSLKNSEREYTTV